MKKKKYKYRKWSIKKKFIVISIIFLTISILIDHQMRPLVKSIASTQAQIVSTNVISQVVIDEISRLDIDYSDIVDIQKDELIIKQD